MLPGIYPGGTMCSKLSMIFEVSTCTVQTTVETTLIYALGARIAKAAGTRLALQLILDKGFKLFSFQLTDLERPVIVIYCH